MSSRPPNKGPATKPSVSRLPEPFSTQISYSGLINNDDENEVLKQLARLTMQTRVEDEIKTKPRVVWNEGLSKPIVLWKLAAKNYAAASMNINIPGKDIVTLASRAYSSSPGERSSEDPRTHSERFVLQDLINQAYDQGWRPKDKDGRPLGKISNSPSPDKLIKYADALKKDANIILFSEREPCNRKHGTYPQGVDTCNEFLKKMLIGKQHKIYHSVDWNHEQKEQFEKNVKEARITYYRITHNAVQETYLEDHQEEARVAEENYKQYQQRKQAKVTKPESKKSTPKPKEPVKITASLSLSKTKHLATKDPNPSPQQTFQSTVKTSGTLPKEKSEKRTTPKILPSTPTQQSKPMATHKRKGEETATPVLDSTAAKPIKRTEDQMPEHRHKRQKFSQNPKAVPQEQSSVKKVQSPNQTKPAIGKPAAISSANPPGFTPGFSKFQRTQKKRTPKPPSEKRNKYSGGPSKTGW